MLQNKNMSSTPVQGKIRDIKSEPCSSSPITASPSLQDVSPYTLNKGKAVKKIMDAANRNKDIDLTFHAGQLVMDLSAAAYHIMQKVIADYYQRSEYQVVRKDKLDLNNIVTEVTLSIQDKDNNKLTIRMYHTTSRILVNGSLYSTFVSQHLQEITKSLPEHDELLGLNTEIMSRCSAVLNEKNPKRKPILMETTPVKQESILKEIYVTPSKKESPSYGKGSMDDLHTSIIRTNYTYLTKEVDCTEITDYMFQEFIFNQEDLDKISANKEGRIACMRLFLQILLNSGKRAFSKFIEGLRFTGYGHVADILETTKILVSDNENR